MNRLPASPGLPPLRPWQRRAIDEYHEADPRDFLAVATPGAGKTTLALALARDLWDRRLIDRLVVVTPTDHLKRQWAAAADVWDLHLAGDFGRGTGLPSDVHGPVLTYAGVAAAGPGLRQLVASRRTLVVLDEIHHSGDSLTWGESVQEAFAPARRRLGLTGTPFRSDVNPIPFVTYVRGSDGRQRSRADFSYGYGDALSDGAVRPVIFLAYGGTMTWRTRAGDLLRAALAERQTKEVAAAAWRTALDPEGEWIARVLRDADRRLSAVRESVPDAGGLVLATDQTAARAYARRLRELTGHRATVVVSEDPSASAKIDSFAASSDRWLVAVRMVSEGVDIPRLMVGVYATATATELYFAQAVGRFVRSRGPGETASVFLPSVPRLLAMAAELELERDHVLVPPGERTDAEDAKFDEVPTERDEVTEGRAYEPVSSEAALDRVVYDGGVFDGALLPESDEEEAFLGIPGLLGPEEVTALLREHRARRQTQAAVMGRDPASREGGTSGPRAAASSLRTDARAALRSELNGCARAYARMKGLTPAAAHGEARRHTGGPPAGQADAATLQRRIDYLRGRAVGG